VTDSVLEAVILEANYIKKFQPKYNVKDKDDSSFNFIVITKDKYPKVKLVRQHELELKISNFKFQISNKIQNSDKLQIPNSKFQNNLFGPYPGVNVKTMTDILRRLFKVSSCNPNQKKPCFYYQLGQCLGVCTGEISPADYKKKVIKPLVMFLKGNKKRLINNLEKEMIQASKEENFEEAGRLRNQIGGLKRIQDIALLNRSFVESDKKLEIRNWKLFENCNLKIENLHIEGYDISNLGETGKVGSMVVFTNGEPDKSQYRKFKIKTVEGQSDVDCLAEVIQRRLNHPEWPLPNLFLIDGGKPQVNAVCKVIKLKSLKVPVVGIAKGRERKRNDIIVGEWPAFAKATAWQGRREFIRWVSNNKDVLIRVRDEAHRFAINYQKKLRKI
jgi:excinuclease ABC subunit C